MASTILESTLGRSASGTSAVEEKNGAPSKITEWIVPVFILLVSLLI